MSYHIYNLYGKYDNVNESAIEIQNIIMEIKLNTRICIIECPYNCIDIIDSNKYDVIIFCGSNSPININNWLTFQQNMSQYKYCIHAINISDTVDSTIIGCNIIYDIHSSHEAKFEIISKIHACYN